MWDVYDSDIQSWPMVGIRTQNCFRVRIPRVCPTPHDVTLCIKYGQHEWEIWLVSVDEINSRESWSIHYMELLACDRTIEYISIKYVLTTVLLTRSL